MQMKKGQIKNFAKKSRLVGVIFLLIASLLGLFPIGCSVLLRNSIPLEKRENFEICVHGKKNIESSFGTRTSLQDAMNLEDRVCFQEWFESIPDGIFLDFVTYAPDVELRNDFFTFNFRNDRVIVISFKTNEEKDGTGWWQFSRKMTERDIKMKKILCKYHEAYDKIRTH
jgi:hypothetical protein